MPDQPQIQVNISDQKKGGEYSDVAMVWHTQFGFTLDFLAQVAPEAVQTPQGAAVPFEVVARVRIPPPVIFQLMKALNDNLHKYESKFGPVPQPPDTEGQDE